MAPCSCGLKKLAGWTLATYLPSVSLPFSLLPKSILICFLEALCYVDHGCPSDRAGRLDSTDVDTLFISQVHHSCLW